ncbi:MULTISPECIES: Myb-like DNA-binding domain-containing protein [unclassified Bradyrhizobium]|uniref:Myb-like DNA-binding domain-containing protein n=1 Tax=unclassified Bradyrhizobium TaxID=2631580 RepID=UPI0013E1EF25|nr:hypothetical protein G6P99_36135 [Bradyrhizobium sp. 6(2017)]
MSANQPWTPEDDQLLLELRAAGKRPTVIAKALRRSEASIVGRTLILKHKREDERVE